MMFNTHVRGTRRKRERESGKESGRKRGAERAGAEESEEGRIGALDTGFAWSVRLVGKTTSRGRSSTNVLPVLSVCIVRPCGCVGT